MLLEKYAEKLDYISLNIERKLRGHFLKKIEKSISFPQIIIIRYLSIKKESTVSDISHYMNSSLSATTSLLNTMVKLHIIERKRSETDRRKVFISLTQKGEKVYTQFKKNRVEFFKIISNYFEDEEIIQFNNFVVKLINVTDDIFEKELTNNEK